MVEITLGLIIAALLYHNYKAEQMMQKERHDMMRALQAKTLQEFDVGETIREPSEPVTQDTVAFEQADEGVFKKHLESILNAKSQDGIGTEPEDGTTD